MWINLLNVVTDFYLLTIFLQFVNSVTINSKKLSNFIQLEYYEYESMFVRIIIHYYGIQKYPFIVQCWNSRISVNNGSMSFEHFSRT